MALNSFWNNTTDFTTSINVSTPVETAPLHLAHLLPETGGVDFTLQVMSYGVLPFLGLVTNTLSIVVLVRGNLLNNWTHSMILNLSITDLILCAVTSVLYFPPAIKGWYVTSSVQCFIFL